MDFKTEVESKVGKPIPDDRYWNIIMKMYQQAMTDDLFYSLRRYWLFHKDSYLDDNAKNYLMMHCAGDFRRAADMGE